VLWDFMDQPLLPNIISHDPIVTDNNPLMPCCICYHFPSVMFSYCVLFLCVVVGYLCDEIRIIKMYPIH